MNQRVGWSLLALVILALGVAVWTGWDAEDPTPLSAASKEHEGSSDPANTGEDAVLRGRGTAPPPFELSALIPGRPFRPAPTIEPTAKPAPARPAITRSAKRTPVTLRGRVTVKGGPSAGSTVTLLGARAAEAGDEARAPAQIGPEGGFELPVPAAGRHTLVVSVRGRQRRTVSVRLDGHSDEHTVEVVYGEGRIHGVVRDQECVPVDGVPVRCSSYLVAGEGESRPSAPGSPFGTSVQTRDGGHYEFRDLPAGTYVLVAQPGQGRLDPRNIRSYKVHLSDAESRRLDIGGARYDPVWSGTVRYADGEAVAYAGNIFLVSDDHERRLYVSFQAGGRYSQEVPPGTYHMEFVLYDKDIMLGTRLVQTDQRLEVPETGSTEDAIVPGGRLQGRFEETRQGGSSPRAATFCLFTLEESDAPRPPSLIAKKLPTTMKVSVDKNGTFKADGLIPGRWRISGGFSSLLGPGQMYPSTPVTVHAGVNPDLSISLDPGRR